MKKIFNSIGLLLLLLPNNFLFASDDETKTVSNETTTNQKIQITKSIPSTPVKDQYKTSTCWSFSTVSLLESELIRSGKGEYDLSEMFIIHHDYERKAIRYVRMHGKSNFSPGGEANDVTDAISEYGIVPEQVYSGLRVNAEKHVHTEMDRVLEKYISTIADSDKELSTVWEEGFDRVLDSYLGEIPDSFIYEGKTYTSASFAASLGLQLDNYVMITSFMKYPYYEKVILEIPDNWSWASSYNVPLDVLESIVDTAINEGYSVAWAADISETGFSFKKGLALVPKILYAPESAREGNKWKKKSDDEKDELMFSLTDPVEEVQVTPEIRQQAFDDYTTTDDHGMHILGFAQDKNGRQFYYVKNSWGTDNPYNGYIYVSRPYFQYKTISIMLNKEALTPKIRSRLNL
jgi:bleomycin hydrolase